MEFGVSFASNSICRKDASFYFLNNSVYLMNPDDQVRQVSFQG